MGKGHDKGTNLRLIIKLIVKVRKDDIFALASQLAYYMILSFIPLIIFLISLIAWINVESINFLSILQGFLPSGIYSVAETIMKEIINARSMSLVGGSIFVAIWMASSGFRALIKGINKAYNLKDTRSYIRRTIIAYIGTIIFALSIIAALAVIVFGRVIGEHLLALLPNAEIFQYIWIMFRYVIMLVFLVIIFTALYKFTPCKRFKLKEVLPGAIVSALGWLISSFGFSYYVNNFNNYTKFYGSLAAIFIMMLWMFITSMVIIFGVEVNSVLVNHKEENNI
ncbi:YihY/virulence factor BrkB family protein [Clostridium sp. MSJ-8]|uniref:YihY/virulence factor BrkB family protein n=1 Tax=Clostridium sp. MSJ-8 TaxID=2841510 RepID=UPI001C0EA062|nr:YihY/virulence factor BrkB family protein [Clostridium sp. MSJ-8]MBU5488337.1 YihY/virulence factor BrkB family protein [Clostridium sp. MSJ-8]